MRGDVKESKVLNLPVDHHGPLFQRIHIQELMARDNTHPAVMYVTLFNTPRNW